MKTIYLWRLRIFTFLLAQFYLFTPAFAQNKQAASGTVLNENSLPMPGVTVVVTNEKKQGKKTTQTDNLGKFKFESLEDGNSYLFTFSHIGYTEKTVGGYRANNASGIVLEIHLEPAAGTSSEVVVVGYGRTSKRDVTGAVKSIKSGEFNKGIVNSPEELLQGKVSGVNVTSASGEPGGMQAITVRGPGGIRTGNTPLYVVDGLALDNSSVGGATNPLSFINPQDIEAIDVLKDASATAIYGSRGANGVVLITTKKGRSGFSQINYSFTGGQSKIARALPVFSAAEYKKEVVALGGTLEDFGGSTDWQKEVTRTGFTQNHNVGMSGGSNNFSYYASFGLQNQEGILKGSDLKRYTGRINVTQKALDGRLVIEAGVSASNISALRPDIGSLIGGSISTNPTIPAYGPDGRPYQFQNGTNPLLVLALESDKTITNRVVGNISGALTLAKGLVYKLNFGVDNSTAARDIQSLPNTVPVRLGALSTINNTNRNYLVENYLTYNAELGEHKFTALAGHSFQKVFVQGRATSINNFSSSTTLPIYNPGTGTELTLANNRPTGYALENELQSFFGRINYQYLGKYLLTATVRADGSTKFGENNKYGTFPSFSGAWIISKERFLENSNFLTNLKLRAGWGKTGNQEIPSKITQAYFTTAVTSTGSYPLYPTGTYPSGTTYSRLANPNIQWEVSTQTDIGLDFEILKGAVSGTIDYFRKQTNNILLQVITPDPIQPASTVWTNVKDMTITNQGVEFDLNYKNTTKGGFSYSIGGNITFIDNVVKKSPYSVIPSGSASGSGLTSATINGYINNEPIGTFFLRQFDGFDANGISKYVDVNKDGVVNDADRVASGTALPKRMYNIYGTAAYKGFDLAINFNGLSGNKIYDNTANTAFYKALLWKGINTTPEAIQYPQESTSNSAPVSSRFLKEGKFFRLNNLSLGYSFNTAGLGIDRWVKSIRLSATAQNVFVATPYNGYDPEVNTDRTIDGVLSYGIDYLSYPKARTYMVGLNVTF
jgi:TonB-linked SusC/RagA family outer membrane protein